MRLKIVLSPCNFLLPLRPAIVEILLTIKSNPINKQLKKYYQWSGSSMQPYSKKPDHSVAEQEDRLSWYGRCCCAVAVVGYHRWWGRCCCRRCCCCEIRRVAARAAASILIVTTVFLAATHSAVSIQTICNRRCGKKAKCKTTLKVRMFKDSGTRFNASKPRFFDYFPWPRLYLNLTPLAAFFLRFSERSDVCCARKKVKQAERGVRIKYGLSMSVQGLSQWENMLHM